MLALLLEKYLRLKLMIVLFITEISSFLARQGETLEFSDYRIPAQNLSARNFNRPISKGS